MHTAPIDLRTAEHATAIKDVTPPPLDQIDLFRAPRTCPRCAGSWVQIVDRPGMLRHSNAVCYPCRGKATSSAAEKNDALEEAPTLVIPAGDWVDYALCAQTDPEAFFPEQGGSSRSARKVCGDCPVAADCLSWAMTTDEPHGIWGGLSPSERRTLRVRLAA